MSYSEEINARLRQVILDSGMSYHKLADKAGMFRTTIENYMRKKGCFLSSEALGKLCRTLGVSADWVLGLTDEDGKRADQDNGYEPPNAPLTLDELREMDGEPVWTVEKRDDSLPRQAWGIVSVSLARVAGNDQWLPFEAYELIWTAYRRKPEGE